MELLRFPPVMNRSFICGVLFSKSTLIPDGTRAQRCVVFVPQLYRSLLGYIDLEFILSQCIVIEHADRLISICLRGHGHESETL